MKRILMFVISVLALSAVGSSALNLSEPTMRWASDQSVAGFSAFNLSEPTISWASDLSDVGEGVYELTLTGSILSGWHTYPLGDGPESSSVTVGGEGITLSSEASWTLSDSLFVIVQRLSAPNGGTVVGSVSWQSCTDTECAMREEWEFSERIAAGPGEGSSAGATASGTIASNAVISAGATVSGTLASGGVSSAGATASDTLASGAVSAGSDRSDGALWALILEAILWGLAMLLTPCVFPMVPMTVSFFLKGSSGRTRAALYGFFIVLLYTVPICIIIGLTWLLGGSGVTADIFNWLSTHWLPNIIFFLVFMAFAASFFGAFEITLPSRWVNASDSRSDRGGVAGVFFLALTLVLVSFSCTGPIVGTVLIKSTGGEFWTPMVTMLAFSVAFALPFTLLALFPSLLKRLPRSGGWLGRVKVVLGFVELALGLKFLSTADQTYHWGLLDRPVYLAIWIVCFTLLGFYLLGKIRFRDDAEVKYISFPRLLLVIADFAFVVWLIPGMWGAPLKALSGYLPPMQTQDFVVGSYGPAGACSGSGATCGATGAGSTAGASCDAAGAGSTAGAACDAAGAGSTAGASCGATGTCPTAGALCGAAGAGSTAGASCGAAAHGTADRIIAMPHGLWAYTSIEDACAAAAASGRRVFVDITGHGCVNCREMEARVWSDPEVLRRLRDDFVMVALYTDDKVPLPESDWIVAENGRKLKDVGRVNSYIARTRFGVNSQPSYIILSPDGSAMSPIRGYDLSIPGFLEFLQ